MTDQAADYDSPWKEAISRYFPPFMEFFFPQAYANINWERGYEFLDTELMQVVREAELGKRWVDKLVKVWRINGSETWVLVHEGSLPTGIQPTRYFRDIPLIEAFEEGIQQGRLQGARENLITILETRFGEVPNSLVDLINPIESYSLLMTLHERAITIGSLAEFQQMLAQLTSESAQG